jgi:hypothetical protein
MHTSPKIGSVPALAGYNAAACCFSRPAGEGEEGGV